MPLHILKLCVGCDSIADLESWIEENQLAHKRLKRPYEQTHTTRMVPKRLAEITAGGSLYWVIKGQVAARQRLLEIRPFTDRDGIGRCHLVMDQQVIAVRPRPCRAFQGWRYLTDKDAPKDMARGGKDLRAMPEDMRRDLAAMGLL